MTNHTHTLDIYGTKLHLATTKQEWKQLRRQHPWLTKAPDALGLAWFNIDTPPTLILWVDVNQHHTTTNLIDTLAHEATHGATSILEHAGHHAHDEPHAYLVGWLTAWIWQHIHGES